MGIFKDNVTGWFSVVPIDGEYDLKSLSKSIKLLIEVNSSELTSYISYLIAIFSIFIPLYFTLWNFNASLLFFLIIMELNAISIVILLRKIKNTKQCNEMMIESYNSIQSEIGGSCLIRIEGEKEEVEKKCKEWCKKYNFKTFSPSLRINSHNLARGDNLIKTSNI